MKVGTVELREVRLPLREPFRARSGVRTLRRILLVRLEGDGEVGWGECVALEDPGYTSETVESAWHILTGYLLPDAPGRVLESPGQILAASEWIRGHPMAKAALEMAAWDLFARACGTSLAEYLGGTPGRVPVGVSLGFQEDEDHLLRKVEGCLSRGYRRIKVKIRPSRDLEPLRAIRDRFGPDLALMADANGAYGADDLPRLRELDAFDLLMIEQPLPPEDFLGHARLQAEMKTPLCLDESLASPADVELALELHACRIVNLKPGRVGGLGPAVAIHDLCRARKVPLWCGGMLESGIGRAHSLALATLPGFTLPGDLSESGRYWERDLVQPPFVLENGGLRVPDGPGIGVAPDEPWIEELTVRRESFS